MVKYKTCFGKTRQQFDEELNRLVSDGWEIAKGQTLTFSSEGFDPSDGERGACGHTAPDTGFDIPTHDEVKAYLVDSPSINDEGMSEIMNYYEESLQYVTSLNPYSMDLDPLKQKWQKAVLMSFRHLLKGYLRPSVGDPSRWEEVQGND